NKVSDSSTTRRTAGILRLPIRRSTARAQGPFWWGQSIRGASPRLRHPSPRKARGEGPEAHNGSCQAPLHPLLMERGAEGGVRRAGWGRRGEAPATASFPACRLGLGGGRGAGSGGRLRRRGCRLFRLLRLFGRLLRDEIHQAAASLGALGDLLVHVEGADVV